MNPSVDRNAEDWVDAALARLNVLGLVVVPGIFSEADRERTVSAFARASDGMREEIGEERVRARTDVDGQLRLPMKYDPHFYSFLECPELLALVDRYLSPSAILRFQNGEVVRAGACPSTAWHMNGRRVLNGYRAALEVVVAIDGFEDTEFLWVLGSHQRMERPDIATLDACAQAVPIPAGSLLVFDSTLWHRQGPIGPSAERRLVVHQFTRHFFKPHIDYVRALGVDVVRGLPDRTRRLLGWDSRVPASLNEFYADPAERLYIAGQD